MLFAAFNYVNTVLLLINRSINSLFQEQANIWDKQNRRDRYNKHNTHRYRELPKHTHTHTHKW